MDMNVLHDKLFDMLMMFDELCRKHGITYFLDSGCAIGAVREHDFIPWDDDIDVAITREEYMKLREILKDELPENWVFVEPKDFAPYFFDFIPRIIDMSVPLRKETERDRAYKNYQNRMSIDFFILDSVPDSRLTHELIKFKCKMLYGMARSRRYDNDTSKMNLKEKILSCVCSFLGKFISLNKIIDMYLNTTMKYADKKSETYFRSNSTFYFIDVTKKEYYKDVIYMDFHNAKLPMPVGYHEVLTKLYGDYMTPTREYKGYVEHIEHE